MPDRMSSALREIANKEALRLQSQKARLESDKLEAENHLKQIKLELHAANFASRRLEDFEIKGGTGYQCPVCWIRHGRKSLLNDVGSDTSEDVFRCRACGLEFAVP